MIKNYPMLMESLRHCAGIDDDHQCDMDCPFWRSCSGDNKVIGHDYLRILQASTVIPPERSAKFIDTLRRCVDPTEETCNEDCPYWSVCKNEEFYHVFEDLYQLMDEFGYMETYP